MKQIKITIPIKAMPLNHIEKTGTIKTRSGKTFTNRYKTNKYKVWAQEVSLYLNENQKDLISIASKFRPQEHCFVVSYIFELKNLFVKSGPTKNQMSKTAGDVDNFIKPIQDLLFRTLSVYNEHIDDSQVLALNARKLEGKMDKITIELNLIEY